MITCQWESLRVLMRKNAQESSFFLNNGSLKLVCILWKVLHLTWRLLTPSNSDINLVIMDYLISEGYPGAAEKFAQESNIFLGDSLDLEGIKERVRIRNAIFGGRIDEAVVMINDVDAGVCALFAHLTLLHDYTQVSCTTLIRPHRRC